jgi:hypothetical protein
MVRQHRRNFLPALLISLTFWIAWFLIIFSSSPSGHLSLAFFRFNLTLPLNIIFFFLTLTFASTLTFALLLGDARRGLFLALFCDAYLWLRLIKQASWLNFFLIFAFFLTSEIYFSSRRKKDY